jgi:TRAP-type C4-dicarboxylate transport system, small permease component
MSDCVRSAQEAVVTAVRPVAKGKDMDDENTMKRRPASPMERVLEWVIVPLMLGLIALGFVAVCLRFVAGGEYALFWSEEVIRYGFIWLFWLCAPVLVWQGAMFTVDMVFEALPAALRTPVRLLINLLVMGLTGIFAYQGWRMTELNMGQESSALGFPLGIVYAAIPFGCAAIFLVVAWQSAALLSGRRAGGGRA